MNTPIDISNEIDIFELLRKINVTKIGICRGANEYSVMKTCMGESILTVRLSDAGRKLSFFTGCNSYYAEEVNYKTMVGWVMDDGTCWTCDVEIVIVPRRDPNIRYLSDYNQGTIRLDRVGKWKKCTKLYSEKQEISFPQTDAELQEILHKTNPYGLEYCLASGFSYASIAMAPYIETLLKAGYRFPMNFSTPVIRRTSVSDYDIFNRLCKPGTSPKTIFKTSKAVYETLKEETDLKVWDETRKLMKFGRISKESLQSFYNSGLRAKNLELAAKVMGSTYEGKQVFSWDSLSTYLRRIDIYEAIGNMEGLQLLVDYLRMCRQLKIKPKTDSDSLKREHDVAARMCSQARNEAVAKNMQTACDEMAKYNYSEKVFFASAVSSYDDLIDEANQQRNCVASYASYIATGKSLIFKVRETANPDKSLITVELDPRTLNVRQKFLACNQPIRSKAQQDFIGRWLREIKERKKSRTKKAATAV